METARILVIHGPNLNLLGTREPNLYGDTTLGQINQDLLELAEKDEHYLEIFQSNHEGEIVDVVQKAAGKIDLILINPAAFTHTSVAIRDALAAVGIPFVEVHLSNPHAREPFRHKSLFTDLAVGCVQGFGALSYPLAWYGGIQHIERDTK
jgi:3-dehydroquinate dehydratase-2